MNHKLKIIAGAIGLATAVQASAEITFFENPGFAGRSFTVDRSAPDLNRSGFNDRASSIVVARGAWEVCEDAGFSGRCVVLQPGSYGSLTVMGLNNSVSSVRRANNGRAAVNVPQPGYAPSGYDYRRKDKERVYEAPVTSVHAVVGPPEQRCWVERQDVGTSSDLNVPGAIVGAVIGGILGHQVGGGRGQDVATGVGAVGGAAVGANVGRGNGQVVTQDVQRCRTVAASGRPDYWDVTYNFKGYAHRVQMTAPPGPTILVNASGEPRV